MGLAVLDPFGGKALNPVDKKGRVSVPAAFRATVLNRHKRAIADEGFDPAAGDPEARHADAGRQLTILKDPERPCLIAFEPVYARYKMRSDIEARHADLTGEARERAIKDDLGVFGAADPFALDVNGRIMLPARLCKKIEIDLDATDGLGNCALFFSFADTFEIWNPANFIAAYPKHAEAARDLIEDRTA